MTTQFYFAQDVTFSGDEALLLIEMSPAEDDLGRPVWVGERDLFLNIE